VFGAFFLLALVVLTGLGVVVIRNGLDQRLSSEIAGLDRLSRDVGGTLQALQAQAIDEPCSEPFLDWMRRVAFLPDGIHEIIYARNGQLLCSVAAGKLDTPVALGNHDFAIGVEGHTSIWLDRDLGILGFPGIVGTFLSVSEYIVVLPDFEPVSPMPDGMHYEIVSRGHDGIAWHRQGKYGLFSAVSGAPGKVRWDVPHVDAFSTFGCDAMNINCIALTTPLTPLIEKNAPVIAGTMLLAALLAGIVTHLLRGVLAEIWSLPSRFRHTLSAETIVCHYQPLLDLRHDRISGVEVLARWRDDDGTLIHPDKFLPIVEQRGMHRALTKYVVDRAYRELSTLPAGTEPLMVHFNIFPCEFAPGRMLMLFKDFLADKSRFSVVIELVENDALPIERTRDTIADLRKEGILTFIDDFGEGYSSIGYLAGLGTYGVKLDRSFGLAPEGSLMEAMLTSAIEMVSKTGQTIVVEGVETPWRLASLKANPKVSIGQGYFISRPVDIEALKIILGSDGFGDVTEAA
jgi:sensor c-di-GMP phosphodiesterase-like protein